jgi:hypothetical protein
MTAWQWLIILIMGLLNICLLGAFAYLVIAQPSF